VNVKSGQFTWSSSANLTIGRNKLVSFPGIEKTSFANGEAGIIVGQPLFVKKLSHYVGIDPDNGQPLMIDELGNPSYGNPTKYDIILSNLTKYYGGIVNNISFKGFQLDFLIQFVRKTDTRDMFWYNGNLDPGRFYSGLSNQSVTVMDDRWQKPGDASRPPYSTSSLIGLSVYDGSDAGYSFDASYIRLKNVSLSWQLPAGWLKSTGMQNVRIYAHAQNLLTVTKYTGLDPESMGIGTLPPLRMITVGCNIEF
jgi:TonB-dependent starch-binding outer membrane protein SusC